MNPFILWSAFVVGFVGSLHCLGMCGPLALSLPFPAQGGKRGYSIVVFYLAKAIAYGILGGIMGLLGKVVFLMEWQQSLSVTAGIFILLMAALPALRYAKAQFLFQKQFVTLHSRLSRRPRIHYFFLLGFLNGLLPCGLVYTALATATLAGDIAGGSVAMLLFGLGTAPSLIFLVLLKHRMNVHLRMKLLPLSTMLSVFIGILLILRGLSLGIPYLSPQVKEDKTLECCHKPAT